VLFVCVCPCLSVRLSVLVSLPHTLCHFRTPTGTPSGQRDLSGKATSSGPMPQVVPANMDTSTILSEDGGKACEGCLCKLASHACMSSVTYTFAHLSRCTGDTLVFLGSHTRELSCV